MKTQYVNPIGKRGLYHRAADDREVVLSFSSEFPVLRRKHFEILSHDQA